MILRAIREGLGRVVILADYLTRPKQMEREESEQGAIDQATADLSLYQFHACPFCVKTRRAIHRLNLSIPLRDIRQNPADHQALLEGGGNTKVPCLRIVENGETQWMYESNDIIRYLEERFA